MPSVEQVALIIIVAVPLAGLAAVNFYLLVTGELNALLLPLPRAFPAVLETDKAVDLAGAGAAMRETA